MKRDKILTIDCGTQSLRTIIFDSSGIIIEKEKMEYTPYSSPNPGWAEQDPEVFWSAFILGCDRLKKKAPEAFAEIGGIGVTSQRDTMINLAEDGSALRPSITWLDTRKAEGQYRPNFLMKGAYRAIGMDKVVRKTMRDGGCNWVMENQPEIWKQTYKYVEVSGFFNYRLCGEAVDSVASMVGHLPFDSKKRGWAASGNFKSKMFPVPKEKQYRLTEAGETAGFLTGRAAAETGLTEGIPVIACGSDKACETLGTGCLDTSTASLSFGTTATVEVTTKKYFEPLPFLPAYCAAYPGAWVPEIEIYRGYWMISWFRDELGHIETEEACKAGVLTEELLDRLLEAEPAGCTGLMMQPYWGPGLKDPLAKGSFIGFGDTHTRSSMYRATIEGLGYALRDGLETLEKRGRFKSEKIAVSGGASQSDLICQISSDIMGMPLMRGETYEASSLGAAVLTAAGIGLHDSIDTAAEEMIRRGQVFQPRQPNYELYSKLFGVYRRIYPKLKGLYQDIQNITGYPEI